MFFECGFLTLCSILILYKLCSYFCHGLLIHQKLGALFLSDKLVSIDQCTMPKELFVCFNNTQKH